MRISKKRTGKGKKVIERMRREIRLDVSFTPSASLCFAEEGGPVKISLRSKGFNLVGSNM